MYTSIPLLVFFAVCARGLSDPPPWPTTYHTQGTLSLPYAEINEPFTAYYAPKLKKSRINFYGEIVSTIQDASKSGEFGQSYKITPVTNEKVLNQNMCFLLNGTKDEPVGMQTVLPDLTGFKKIASDVMKNDAKCDQYQKIEMTYDKKSTYTMWLMANSSNGDVIPVRYEMLGYDTLLGSHYDRYYIDYTNFIVEDIKPAVFDIPKGLKCGDFPGPGATRNRVSMNPMQEFIHQEDRHTTDSFNHFKKTHAKKYGDDTVERRRLHVFRQNLRFIHSKNRASLGYTLGINHLADRTDEELAVLRGKLKSSGYNGGLPFPNELKNLKDVPDQVDWRLYGAVTPVKDQAVCGSCWSFGTVGTLEGTMFLTTGKLIRLSQQELIDCSWGFGNNACDGGEDFRAYQWIMKHGGISSEESYGRYMGQNGQCHSANATKVFSIKGYVNVTSGDQNALRNAIAVRGPISVAIDASHKTLSFYSNGVYYEPQCRSDSDGLDHAVLAVGYGTINGQDYWLIKNSWSTYWGNDGYVLMSQKNNNCGVATSATYPVA